MSADRPNVVPNVRMLARLAPLFLLVIAVFSLILFPLRAVAQTGQGSISGRVTDTRGSVVVRAAVTITSNDTGVQYKTETNTSGIYNVTPLIPGTYTVEVTAKSFERSVVAQVIVGEAQATEINLTLVVGRVNETITVQAEDSLLSKNVSDVSTTVDHELVESLPYPERSSLEAVLLVPGVTGDVTSPGGIDSERPNFTVGPVTPGAGITVGGTPPGGTSIMVDGSDVTQGSYARSGINLSGQLVQETTVIVTGMSAQYGRSGAGIIVQGSRSGTQAFHGGLSYRHTDPFFDAQSKIASNRQNYYGFYLGGPVRIPKLYNGSNKTFFFAGVEPARVAQKYTFRAIFMTPADLAGHLYGSLALGGGDVWYQSSAVTTAAANPTLPAGFPTGTQLTSGYTMVTGPLADCGPAYIAANPSATVCPDDLAPQLAQNPFAQFILSQMPTPSNPGPYATFDNALGTPASDNTNGTYNRGVVSTDNRYSIRIDHQINNSNRIFARYTSIPINSSRIFALATDNPINQTPRANTLSTDLATGFTHIFSNNVVGNFHYSFLRVNQPSLEPTAALTKDFAGSYGLTPAVLGVGMPRLGGFNGPGGTYTIQPGATTAKNIDENFIVGGDITWTRGTHLIQLGTDIRWIQSNQYDLSGLTGGQYNFGSNQTNNPSAPNGHAGGSSLATFILGDISTFTNTPVPVPGYYRWRYYAGYIQDNWRATPRLTINFGLRYNVETPRMEKFNNQGFVTAIPGASSQIISSQFCFSGACGEPKTLWPTNYKGGLEPRLGFAFAPTPRSTLRASYALSHLPLSGYESIPDPNFNVASTAVGGVNGGVNGANQIVNYITNPVAGNLVSAYTSLSGRGPFYYPNGLSPVFVSQTNAVPYIQNYSMTYQFQPFAKTLIQVTYNGTKGTHLVGAFNQALNTAPLSAIINGIQTQQNLAISTPSTVPNGNTGTFLAETTLQRLEPYQNFFNQNLPEIYPRRGTLEYNGLYTSINQRYNKNLSFLASWVWNKGLDNIPDNNAGTQGGYGSAPPQNPFDMKGEYSISVFDQPSKLKAGYTYLLPFGINQRFNTGHRWIDNVLGGINLSGIATVASGFPNFVNLGTTGYFTSITPSGLNSCTASGTNKYCISGALPSGYALRPNIVPGVPLINKNWRKNPYNSLAPGGITPYLNPGAFAVPGSINNPQLGNARRTLANARTPREFMFDMNGVKSFTVHGRNRVTVTVTAVNVFNHAIFPALANHNVYSSQTVSTVTGLFAVPVPTVGFGNMNTTSGLARTLLFGGQYIF